MPLHCAHHTLRHVILRIMLARRRHQHASHIFITASEAATSAIRWSRSRCLFRFTDITTYTRHQPRKVGHQLGLTCFVKAEQPVIIIRQSFHGISRRRHHFHTLASHATATPQYASYHIIIIINTPVITTLVTLEIETSTNTASLLRTIIIDTEYR